MGCGAQERGRGAIVFGTAIENEHYRYAKTGFRRKVTAAIVKIDR
ncbi:MAG: hypothetical protein ACI87E_002590 [Mariniblastus sp.]|jgi:hypothetical protein